MSFTSSKQNRAILQNINRKWEELFADERESILKQLAEQAATFVWRKQQFNKEKWVGKIAPKPKLIPKKKKLPLIHPIAEKSKQAHSATTKKKEK